MEKIEYGRNVLHIRGSLYMKIHYCPVKAGKSVFEIVET